jgi:hypothetical protein
LQTGQCTAYRKNTSVTALSYEVDLIMFAQRRGIHKPHNSGAHNAVFDFEYANPTAYCDTAWNALPIAFDDLTIG